MDEGASPGKLLERLAWLNRHIDGLSRERQRLWSLSWADRHPGTAQRVRHLTAYLEDAYAEKRQARAGWRASREGADGLVRGLPVARDRARADA